MSSYGLLYGLTSYLEESDMAHNLGKADWTDKGRISGLVESYSRRYGESFWTALIRLIGESTRETIADFGCGPGLFLVDASQRFSAKRLYGLDESNEMLEQARLFIQERAAIDSFELTAINFDEVDIPLPHRSVDLAFSGYMLHEVKSPQDLVDQVGKTMRPGGQYIVYDFISGDEETFVKKMAEQGMSAERARLRYPHMCKYSIEDIGRFLERAGFQEVRSVAVNHIRALVVGVMK
jgi:ubiquinone/menaquinone biosynthesis C-methylase UbiE